MIIGYLGPLGYSWAVVLDSMGRALLVRSD